MRLENKVAVVTGGGSGFGTGIAVRFAEEGAALVIADINMDAAPGYCQPVERHAGTG